MRVFNSIQEANLQHPTIATIGTYDGVHLGHQLVIKNMVQAARAQNLETAVISFHPRPQAILRPSLPTYYLTMPEDRVSLLADLGVDIFIIQPFTRETAQLSAQEFMTQLTRSLKLSQLWVGHDFALGKNREGDIPRLTELGVSLGYAVKVIEPLVSGSEIVSSTLVRKAVEAGDMKAARALLGRCYSLLGVISTGSRRGRTLGFPTANLTVSEDYLLPPNGVYVTLVDIKNERWPSATNIGIRPSFGGQQRFIEAFIFNFDGDLYEQSLRLELVEWLREEKRFDRVEDLVQQIHRDVAKAKEILAKDHFTAAI
jgi:riboflavin kinase / FMN adenylyltransferase